MKNIVKILGSNDGRDIYSIINSTQEISTNSYMVEFLKQNREK
jgi:hypothetical protein